MREKRWSSKRQEPHNRNRVSILQVCVRLCKQSPLAFYVCSEQCGLSVPQECFSNDLRHAVALGFTCSLWLILLSSRSGHTDILVRYNRTGRVLGKVGYISNNGNGCKKNRTKRTYDLWNTHEGAAPLLDLHCSSLT